MQFLMNILESSGARNLTFLVSLSKRMFDWQTHQYVVEWSHHSTIYHYNISFWEVKNVAASKGTFTFSYVNVYNCSLSQFNGTNWHICEHVADRCLWYRVPHRSPASLWTFLVSRENRAESTGTCGGMGLGPFAPLLSQASGSCRDPAELLVQGA